MSQKVELNFGSVILVLIVFAAMFIAVRMVYNVLKDSIAYTTYNGWNILSKSVLLTWGIPMAAPFICYYYATAGGANFPSWVLPTVFAICGIWLLIMIIGTIRIMGAKYGISVVAFRLILTFFTGVLGAYFGAFILIAICIAAMVVDVWVGNAPLILHGSNGDLVMQKCGDGQLIDQNGTTYSILDDGSLAGGGEIYTRAGNGIYYCSDGNSYYTYR